MLGAVLRGRSKVQVREGKVERGEGTGCKGEGDGGT